MVEHWPAHVHCNLASFGRLHSLNDATQNLSKVNYGEKALLKAALYLFTFMKRWAYCLYTLDESIVMIGWLQLKLDGAEDHFSNIRIYTTWNVYSTYIHAESIYNRHTYKHKCMDTLIGTAERPCCVVLSAIMAQVKARSSDLRDVSSIDKT